MARLEEQVSADSLLRLHPAISSNGALYQAAQQLRDGNLQAAAAWTQASLLLLEAQEARTIDRVA